MFAAIFRERRSGLWVPMRPISGGGVSGSGVSPSRSSGTAGTAAADVQSIQGVAGMTAVQTATATPTAANILSGLQSVTAAGTTVIVSVPATRVWIGYIGCSVTAANAVNTATGRAQAAISTSGAGATPAAGSYLQAAVQLPASAATALNGQNGSDISGVLPFVVIAPVGNAVAINLVASVTGTITTFEADAFAAGILQ